MTDHELLPNPHPGEILAEEFMRPIGLSQNALARSLHVPPRRLNQLVHGRRAVTADTACPKRVLTPFLLGPRQARRDR